MKKISTVIPMYNEEVVVEECYKRMLNVLRQMKNYDYEMLFINDGSSDKTLSKLEEIAREDSKVKIISFTRNFGHQVAVMAGLQYVTGDAIVIIDADLQDPPELIPDMIKLWEEGYDDVYAQRKSRKGESFLKKFTNTYPKTELTENSGKAFRSPETVKYVFVTDVPANTSMAP